MKKLAKFVARSPPPRLLSGIILGNLNPLFMWSLDQHQSKPWQCKVIDVLSRGAPGFGCRSQSHYTKLTILFIYDLRLITDLRFVCFIRFDVGLAGGRRRDYTRAWRVCFDSFYWSSGHNVVLYRPKCWWSSWVWFMSRVFPRICLAFQRYEIWLI